MTTLRIMSAQRTLSTQPTDSTYKKFDDLEDMRDLISSRNLPDPPAKEESAQDSLDMMNDREDLVNLDDANDVIQDVDDQRNPVRRGTRERRTPTLFNPGTDLARNWTSDMVVNQALILDSQ